tara:strand:+ start:289 stop:591 length:303 start_codon:yes stop_codon:yes gene_type:complete
MKKKVCLCIVVALLLFSTMVTSVTNDDALEVSKAWIDYPTIVQATDVIGFLSDQYTLQEVLSKIVQRVFDEVTNPVEVNGKLVYGAKTGNNWEIIEEDLS